MQRVLIGLMMGVVSLNIYASNLYKGNPENSLQAFDVQNQLYNPEASTPGVTAASVTVIYSTSANPYCWTSFLKSGMSEWVYSCNLGEACSCVGLINKVTIKVSPFGNTLYVYKDPDILQTSGHTRAEIIIKQNTPPVFDTKNGLVNIQGTINPMIIPK